jgi:hypothetical protein
MQRYPLSLRSSDFEEQKARNDSPTEEAAEATANKACAEW